MSGRMVFDGNTVYGVWECPECHAKYKMTFYEIQDVGTPVCSDCDVDGEFTGEVIVED